MTNQLEHQIVRGTSGMPDCCVKNNLTYVDTSPEEMSELINAIASNSDSTAFARLFNIFAPRVKTYLLLKGAPFGDAEEIAQETLLMVWRKAAQFDVRSVTAAGWIYTIARNLSVDRFRRDRSRQRPALFEFDDEPPTPEASLSQAQEASRIRKAIAELPNEQANILREAYFSGKTHEQLASSLNLPLGTVKSRISGALNRLRASEIRTIR